MSVRTEFTVHILNEQGQAKANEIAKAFSHLLTSLETLVPKTREHSIVVTKLQEAAFFAKRAIALDPANQKTEG